MKPSFTKYVLEKLEWGTVLSDEQLCSMYIRDYYKWHKLRVATGCLKSMAVIGKRYESSRKQLSKMRKKGKIFESFREDRKNGSSEIFFKII